MLDQDESQGLILFRNGIAKVRRFNSDGEDIVLSLLGPGDVCGEMAGRNNGRRSADVVSVTSCDAVFLRIAPFRELLHSEPRLSLALARLEARRLQELNGRFNGGPMPPPAYWPHFATSHAAPAWEPIASRSFRPCRIGNWPPSRDWPARPHREPLVNGVSEASLRS
jgi:hypothetical protein